MKGNVKMQKNDPWEKEWKLLLKKEQHFLQKAEIRNPSFINQKLENIVPEKLKGKLDGAFSKAFTIVFEKGTGIIEKTYQKDQKEYTYKLNAYATDIKENRKNVKAFGKQAQISNMKNLVLSGIEGVGFGVLGIGIPDIPLFTGVVLKSIYEIALSFGYKYDTEEEQIFILKLIRNALLSGTQILQADAEINELIEGKWVNTITKWEQIEQTAGSLSEELLYMKFLQGIPIAGVIGGLSDAVSLKKITDYAALKYTRRMLWDRKNYL